MDVMSEALRACQKTSMRWIHHLKMRIRELINVVLAVPKIKFLFLGGCGEAYYCSPVKHEKKVLEMIRRKLKKNNVALDIVNFGEEDKGKTEKLEALLAAVNNNDTSHIVHVPTGTNALSDVLISTPIFTGNGEGGSGFAAAAAAAAAGGVSGFEFGVDPNLDPELALALRVSMEEERARQEATTKKAAEEASKQEKGGEQQANSQDATMTECASASASEAETKTNDMMVAL
ncbi:hypothetical protein Ahy_A09g044915 [Arachis hypogaea]|uniref:VWFA domain-containing protein n=1 Tax=Arachis hypogaea TaxID=3818 RepID=A0A445BL49_ARAHY|nr:hypothetical protein Ahy_A09g044915 [Arachis hypogaea]